MPVCPYKLLSQTDTHWGPFSPSLVKVIAQTTLYLQVLCCDIKAPRGQGLDAQALATKPTRRIGLATTWAQRSHGSPVVWTEARQAATGEHSVDRNGKRRWRQCPNLRQFLARKREAEKLKSFKENQASSTCGRVQHRAFITGLSGEGLGVLALQQQGALPATAPGLECRKAKHRGTSAPTEHVALGSRLRLSSCTSEAFLGWNGKEGQAGDRCTGLGALPVLVVPAHRSTVGGEAWQLWRPWPGPPRHHPRPPHCRCCR